MDPGLLATAPAGARPGRVATGPVTANPIPIVRVGAEDRGASPVAKADSEPVGMAAQPAVPLGTARADPVAISRGGSIQSEDLAIATPTGTRNGTTVRTTGPAAGLGRATAGRATVRPGPGSVTVPVATIRRHVPDTGIGPKRTPGVGSTATETTATGVTAVGIRGPRTPVLPGLAPVRAVLASVGTQEMSAPAIATAQRAIASAVADAGIGAAKDLVSGGRPEAGSIGTAVVGSEVTGVTTALAQTIGIPTGVAELMPAAPPDLDGRQATGLVVRPVSPATPGMTAVGVVVAEAPAPEALAMAPGVRPASRPGQAASMAAVAMSGAILPIGRGATSDRRVLRSTGVGVA